MIEAKQRWLKQEAPFFTLVNNIHFLLSPLLLKSENIKKRTWKELYTANESNIALNPDFLIFKPLCKSFDFLSQGMRHIPDRPAFRSHMSENYRIYSLSQATPRIRVQKKRKTALHTEESNTEWLRQPIINIYTVKHTNPRLVTNFDH